MPGKDLRDPHALLRGMRHTRRFEDRPVSLAAIEEMLAAGRAVGGVDLQVLDDILVIEELGMTGTFAQSVVGAPLMILVLRDGKDQVNDRHLGSRVNDAVMLVARRHGLGGGYSWFGAEEAQETARAVIGVQAPTRVVMAIGIGYVDDNPMPGGSSLERVRAMLDSLSGNRNRGSVAGDEGSDQP